MKSCSQLEDIDDLAFGRLEPPRAEALGAHAALCAVCGEELAMVSAERALFVRRAERVDAPPAVAVALEERLLAEVSPAPSRWGAMFDAGIRFLRRGHFSAACAAALFLVVAFSRLGSETSALTSAASNVRADDGEAATPGVLASMRTPDTGDAFACSTAAAPASANDDLGVSSWMSSLSPASSAPATSASADLSLASLSLDGVLACGAHASGARSDTSCEPSVTCSSVRQ